MRGDGLQKVAVIDGDEWSRRGLSQALSELDMFAVVASHDHDEALARRDWNDVDLILVDSGMDSDAWDRYIGVKVTQRIRSYVGRSQHSPHIVAFLNHGPTDVLRLRFAEAGANQSVLRAELCRTVQLLHVLNPSNRPVEVRPEARDEIARLGLSARSRLNAGLDHLQSTGLCDQFLTDAPDMSRRRSITVRSQLAEIMQIEPVAAGSGAYVCRTTPSWRQLTDVVRLARGAADEGGGSAVRTRDLLTHRAGG